MGCRHPSARVRPAKKNVDTSPPPTMLSSHTTSRDDTHSTTAIGGNKQTVTDKSGIRMITAVHRVNLLLVALLLVCGASTCDSNAESAYVNEELPELPPYEANEEIIRHIHSLINAYRADMMGGRLVIETNALIDTKYRTWKRNVDLINSLLALPKGMNDAGR